MNRKTATQEKVRPRRRFWRRTIFITLGLLLGGLAVLFLMKVYNPFMDRVESPLLLVPEDPDFVLSVPDLPGFLGSLRDRPFVKALDAHRGFQAFLKTKDARDTGVADALRQAFSRLDEITARLPYGLELKDVLGSHLVVAGYLPDRRLSAPGVRFPPVAPESDDPAAAAEVRFMVVCQPKSWKVQAGANLLLDRTTYGWIASMVEQNGLKATRHERDLVRLEGEALGQPLWLTRVADALLIGTEERELARIHNFVAQSGIPSVPNSRFESLADLTESFGVQLLVRRTAADRFMRLEERLSDLWGTENLNLVESTLPRIGGEDLLLEVDVQKGLGMALTGRPGKDQRGDLGPLLSPFTRVALQSDFAGWQSFLPKNVYGFVRIQVPLGTFCRGMMEREQFFSEEDRRDLDGMARDLGWIGLDALLEDLSASTGPELGVAFFQQPREALTDKAEAGFAVLCPVTNRDRLESIIERLDAKVQEVEGRGLVRQIYRETVGGVRLVKPVLASGAVDDERVTIPGLAITPTHLIVTNFFPFLRQVAQVVAGEQAAMGGPGFQVSLNYAPRDMRLALVLDEAALYPYLDQSVDGWAFGQTRPSQQNYLAWRAEAERLAMRSGLQRDTPRHADFVDSHISRSAREYEADRPRLQARFRERLDNFRGLFSGLALFAEDSRAGVRMVVRAEPKD